MIDTTNEPRRGAEHSHVYENVPAWREFTPGTIQCRVLTYREKDGRYVARAIRLPSAESRGDTLNDVLVSIRDSFRAEICKHGRLIPLENVDIDRPTNAVERYILVELSQGVDDLTTEDMLRGMQAGGTLDFWNHPDEDIYSLEDGEPI